MHSSPSTSERGPELYICGDFAGFTRPGTARIARFDGQLFESVGGGFVAPGLFDVVRAVAGWGIGQDTDLYIGGTFDSVGGVNAQNVARWDGSRWSALAGSLTSSQGSANSVVVAQLAAGEVNGERLLFASGGFDRVNGAPAPGLAAWDGQAWRPLGGGPMDSCAAHRLSLQDGRARS